MAKRSKVKLFEQIRRARARDPEVSVRELSRRFGVHRRDVRAALASAVPPPRKTSTRAAPVLDWWKPIIDGWLEADRTAPRKQRHTARRVWQRLVEEHDAQIGESTVRNYVTLARRRFDVPLADVMVPQHHPLGEEAEVDFGVIAVYLAGALMDVSLFIMRLSASGRAFPRAYLNEAQESFLDGHVQAFEHFGGVPNRIRYDNLKAAVAKVLKGRGRVESERFIMLRSHYGFDSFFCQPGIKGSHEKGGVEGEVGRFRRRHLVPVPHVGSMAELNELLATGAARDDRRFIAQRRITVAEHFALEAGALAALPGGTVRHHRRVVPPRGPQSEGVGARLFVFGSRRPRRSPRRCARQRREHRHPRWRQDHRVARAWPEGRRGVGAGPLPRSPRHQTGRSPRGDSTCQSAGLRRVRFGARAVLGRSTPPAR
jgi:transposase